MFRLRCISLVLGAVGAIAPVASAQNFEEQVPVIFGFFDLGRTDCADVDGVNGPDIVFCADNVSGFNYGVYLNDGSGGFTIQDIAPDGADGADVVACDWDGDGLMDIIGLEELAGTSGLRLLRQTSLGLWTSPSTLTFASPRDRLEACDIDGDARIDLLVTNPVTNAIEVYLNDGSGSVSALTATSYVMGSGDVTDFTCGDFNADGRPDLAAVTASPSRLTYRLNSGGTFGPLTQTLLGGEPSSIACPDLNGDGLPDLVITNVGNDTVGVRLNNGSGTAFTSSAVIGVNPDPMQVAAADWDCDGDVDLVVASESIGPIALQVLYNADAGASWQVDTTYDTPGDGLRGLHAAEIDGQPGTDLIRTGVAGVADGRVYFNINADCPTCSAPPADLVAWYSGGDFCTPDDLTGNHDAGAIGPGFCPEPKVGGAALGFASSPPTYFSVASSCELDPGDGGLTVNTWVRTNASGSQPIATKGFFPGYDFRLVDGRVRIVVCDTTFCWQATGSSFVDDGDWHHVAFTLQTGPSGSIAVWVDGIRENLVTAAIGDIASNNALLLGAAPSPTPSSYLDGALDELQMHSRVLTAGEIQGIYLAGIAGQCNELCAPITENPPLGTAEYTAGAQDEFTPGSEPTSPGAVLAASCAGSVDFDVVSPGDSVCHTFSALPDEIIGATLELRIRANSSMATCDDTINLQATGGAGSFLWSSRIGANDSCPGSAGLICDTWLPGRTQTFCIDITSSVLDSMNATNRLDVQVEDESAVDYMRLRLALCPCAEDLNGDCEIGFSDLLFVLASWGPCPGCPEDINADGDVDFGDLLLVLSTYGPCE